MFQTNRSFRFVISALAALAVAAVFSTFAIAGSLRGSETKGRKAKHSGGTEPLTKVMPDTQLLDVQTYLINHAADSPQPETCGK